MAMPSKLSVSSSLPTLLTQVLRQCACQTPAAGRFYEALRSIIRGVKGPKELVPIPSRFHTRHRAPSPTEELLRGEKVLMGEREDTRRKECTSVSLLAQLLQTKCRRPQREEIEVLQRVKELEEGKMIICTNPRAIRCASSSPRGSTQLIWSG
ncbi:hypothetical protein B0H14DRAFT_2558170 [Mycena olivaceomarginata]|nr:hypothetical protein B0H14DRAFT_2558170 [Mycena olivaceomarginata]